MSGVWETSGSDSLCQPQQEPVQVCECVGAGEDLDRGGDEQGTKAPSRRGAQEGFFKDKTLGWVITACQGKLSALWVGEWNTTAPGQRWEIRRCCWCCLSSCECEGVWLCSSMQPAVYMCTCVCGVFLCSLCLLGKAAQPCHCLHLGKRRIQPFQTLSDASESFNIL